MKPDLVIFDCDGVLIDSEVISSQIEADMLTAVGYPITVEENLRRFLGMRGGDMLAQIEAEMGCALPDNISEDIEAGVMLAYRQRLNAIPNVLETLQNAPWRFCVASSSRPAKLGLGLIETALFELFYPHIYSGKLVKNGKPAPDLFELAARSMNVDAKSCVVVEDSVAGVHAGKAAGMRVLGFSGGSHCRSGHDRALYNAGAELTFDTFDKLSSIIDFLSQ